MTTEVAIKEVNYYVRSDQNKKSVKLSKEKQKLKIGNLIAHYFYKILMDIYIFFNLCITEFSFGKKKHYFINNTSLKPSSVIG